MRRFHGLAAVVLLFPLTLSAQTTDQRLDAVERRLAEMEKRHQAELKARDEKIDQLNRALKDRDRAHDHKHHKHEKDPDPWGEGDEQGVKGAVARDANA